MVLWVNLCFLSAYFHGAANNHSVLDDEEYITQFRMQLSDPCTVCEQANEAKHTAGAKMEQGKQQFS